MTPPRLAITMGDPAGIGPEIIAKACARLAPRMMAGEFALGVIGSVVALRSAEAVTGTPPIPAVDDFLASAAPLTILEAGPEREPIRLGVMSAEGGRLAYLAIEKAVRLAQAGVAAAIVT